MTKKAIAHRIISILLAVVVMFTITSAISAVLEESVNLYAYSTIDVGAQEYASEKLGAFIQAHGYQGDSSKLKLGYGITIYDPEDHTKVLFPMHMH